MFLIIDNYDSFTYNLVDALSAHTPDIAVYRNDQIGLEQIAALAPTAIIIGSGSGQPRDAGISLEAIRHFAGRIPIVGVGLGHLCVAEAFGSRTVPSPQPAHGKLEQVHHDGVGLFTELPLPLTVTRYDSRIVAHPVSAPLTVTATSSGGDVMGLRHELFPVESVQFHPASFFSEGASRWAGNAVRWARSHPPLEMDETSRHFPEAVEEPIPEQPVGRGSSR